MCVCVERNLAAGHGYLASSHSSHGLMFHEYVMDLRLVYSSDRPNLLLSCVGLSCSEGDEWWLHVIDFATCTA